MEQDVSEGAITEFWETVRQAGGSRERLVELLSSRDKTAVYQFQDAFVEVAAELQDVPFSEFVDDDQSEDGLEDIAHWVVSQGREFYESVLADPTRIPSSPPSTGGEDLFDVAYNIYYQRFGEPLEVM